MQYRYIEIQRTKRTQADGSFTVQRRFTGCELVNHADLLKLNSIVTQLAVMSSRDVVAGQNVPTVLLELFELAKSSGITPEAVPEGPYQIKFIRTTNETIIVGVEFLE